MLSHFYTTLLESMKQNLGQTPENLLACSVNGEPMRFGKKNNCWVFINSWEHSGKTYMRSVYGDWSVNDSKFELKSWDENEKTTKSFDSKYAEIVALQINKEKDARLKRETTMLEEYLPKWKDAKTSCHHVYLTKKQIKAYCSKVSFGTLMIPLSNEYGDLKGFQLIYEKDGKIEKRFSKGTIKKGRMCFLKPIEHHKHIYISEGFATGASVQDIVNDPVIVAFDAGNLKEVCKVLLDTHKSLNITILADNDSTGVEKAKEVSSTYPQVNFIKPAPIGKDFNDIFVEYGETALKSYFQKIDNSPLMECLGYDGKNYAFHSKENRKIVWLTSDQMKPPHIFRIVSKKEYWESLYPSTKNGIDVSSMQSDLHERCHKAGHFDVSKIRGFGIWNDGGAYVVNTGNEVFNKPENSKYYYETDSSFSINYGAAPTHNFDEVLEFFKGINTANEKDFIFLAGWYIQAMVYGILSWRVAGWVSGRAGSGKSTLLEWYSQILPHADNNLDSTPAGITQFARSNQIPVIFDEIEPENQNTVEGILDLARAQSSYKDRNMTKRGTPNGQVRIFNSTLLFLLGSIQQPELKESDRTRIILIELQENKEQTNQEFDRLCELADKIEKNFHHNWNYAYQNIDLIISVKKYALRFFKHAGKSSREADTLSTMVGCFYLLNHDKYDENLIREVILFGDFDNSAYMSDNSENQADNAFSALMGMIVPEADKMSVGSIIGALESSSKEYSLKLKEDYVNYLASYGLKYLGNDELFISKRNGNRTKKLEGYPSLAKIFSREPKFFLLEKREELANKLYARGIVIKLERQVE